jgi:hypothetical protein
MSDESRRGFFSMLASGPMMLAPGAKPQPGRTKRVMVVCDIDRIPARDMERAFDGMDLEGPILFVGNFPQDALPVYLYRIDDIPQEDIDSLTEKIKLILDEPPSVNFKGDCHRA